MQTKASTPEKTLTADARFYASLALAGTLVNWPWEMLQMPFYARTVDGAKPYQSILDCTGASIGDGLIVATIYLMARLLTSSIEPIGRPKPQTYFVSSCLGLLAAIVIEAFALRMGRWSYSTLMPVVPLLGVGVVPLVQLFLLTPGAIWLAARSFRHRQ